MSELAELKTNDHALEIFEERNRIFRIIYDTALEVEGASDKDTYVIICRNLARICKAVFIMFAPFDPLSKSLQMEVYAIKKSGSDNYVVETPSNGRSFDSKLLTDLRNSRIIECAEHKDCLFSIFSQDFKERMDGVEDLKAYKMTCFRGSEPVAFASVFIEAGHKLKMKDLIETYLNTAAMIIDRINMLKALRESEKKYRDIVININDFIYIAGENGKILYANEKAKDILGYEPEELMGKSLSDLLPASSEKCIYYENLKKRTQEGLYGKPFEFPVVTKNGKEIILEVRESLISGEGSSVKVQGICRDVTERIEAQKEIMAKNKELNDFTYTVSHDLKAPINLLSGYLNMIKENPEMFADLFDKTIEQTKKMLVFIEDLLKLSRAGRAIGEKAIVSPVAVFKTIYSTYYRKENGVIIEIDENSPPALIDPKGFSQVFSNLISNSVRYRDPAKEVLTIGLDCKIAGDKYVIRYKDNGSGMSPEELSVVFRAGYTKQKTTGIKGTGFGLAIVKKIIEAHGGTITAESAGVNQGVTFTIKLPV